MRCGVKSPWFNYYFSHEISIESQYLYQKARECIGEGRHDDAVRYLQQAVIMSPRFSKAFYEMGHCYVRLGQYARADDVYHRAATIDPQLKEGVKKELDRIDRGRDPGPGAAAH